MLKSPPRIDIDQIRLDFPILATEVGGKPLVYLDNAATSQKPRPVIDGQTAYWETSNANVHRGVHHLSQRATHLFDAARDAVRVLLNAASSAEVIFTKGCTEGINLVATGLTSAASPAGTTGPAGTPWIGEGDEILLSAMEHHSNIVPWQMAASRVGATVRVIPISDAGEIDLVAYSEMLSPRTRVVGIVHVSNSLGTVNPVKQMIAMAHSVGALVLVDGAQAGPHLRIDVQDLNADFYTLSCHKIYAPTGVGVLYGKRALLEALPPYQGGGDMIRRVTWEGTTLAELPAKFESGTPNIAGVIGLGSAIHYIADLGARTDPTVGPELSSRLDAGYAWINAREHALTAYGDAQLSQVAGLTLTGTSPTKVSILAFTLADAHPHDIGTILDHDGIAIRAGHHCCMPLMRRLGVPATVRASIAFYNTESEIDRLTSAVKKVRRMFQ